MFDNGTLYPAGDPALKILGSPQTLANWRCEGRGPAFIKLGGRVAYRGDDLNRWIEGQRVDPAATAAA